ncbi:MAG: SOS response-associated peptidase [Myxococcota bacterium]
MCGRYKLDTDWTEIVRVHELDLCEPLDVVPRWNVAPTKRMPVVCVDGGRRVARMMHWGLLSPWSKFREAARTINARAETVATSRTFAAAFRERRALVPNTGFYEWRRDGDAKLPMLLRPRHGPLAFAGLWQSWWDPKYEKHVDTYTILTCPPNGTVAPIHDRMPVILPRDAWAAWLAGDTAPDVLLALLRPCADDVLEAVRVSDAVNSIANDGPELARPL